MPIAVALADAVPDDAQVLGIPVFAGRTSPDGAGADLDLAYLAERGFEGKVGETLTVPGTDGGRTVVAVGVGDPAKVTAETLRRSAAALVKAAWRDARVATTLLAAAPADLDPALAAQAVAEGALLASYKFTTYKSDPKGCRIESLAVVGEGARPTPTRSGHPAGRPGGRGPSPSPATSSTSRRRTMTPRRLAEIATQVAEDEGLTIEVLDEIAIVNEGLGGLAGVALGSDEPARLIRLTYDPPRRHRHPRPGGQGDHVRLRRPVDQDGRGHGDDEDRQVGGGRGARRHVGHPRPGPPRTCR